MTSEPDFDDDDDYDDEREIPSALQILEDAFGKNHKKYTIEDGDGWVEADIPDSGDYEAYHIHISYENVAGYAFLTHTIVNCNFPYREAYEEIEDNDEPTENEDVGYDFREEVRDECSALFGGEGGSEDFCPNDEIEFGEGDFPSIIISIAIGSDEEETAVLYRLHHINEDLKKLKEIIDSYKKKIT